MNTGPGDYEGFNAYLVSVNWNTVFQNVNNVNACWESFIAILNQGIDLFVPVKIFDPKLTCKQKKLLPLFVRQLYRKKNAAWRLYKKYKSPTLHAKYKTACDKCKNAYNKFILAKENALIENGNLGSFYRYVNSKIVCKSGVSVLKSSDGEFVYDDATKAKLLNDFYSSVFVVDNGVLPNFPVRENVEHGDLMFLSNLK